MSSSTGSMLSSGLPGRARARLDPCNERRISWSQWPTTSSSSHSDGRHYLVAHLFRDRDRCRPPPCGRMIEPTPTKMRPCQPIKTNSTSPLDSCADFDAIGRGQPPRPRRDNRSVSRPAPRCRSLRVRGDVLVARHRIAAGPAAMTARSIGSVSGVVVSWASTVNARSTTITASIPARARRYGGRIRLRPPASVHRHFAFRDARVARWRSRRHVDQRAIAQRQQVRAVKALSSARSAMRGGVLAVVGKIIARHRAPMRFSVRANSDRRASSKSI